MIPEESFQASIVLPDCCCRSRRNRLWNNSWLLKVRGYCSLCRCQATSESDVPGDAAGRGPSIPGLESWLLSQSEAACQDLRVSVHCSIVGKVPSHLEVHWRVRLQFDFSLWQTTGSLSFAFIMAGPSDRREAGAAISQTSAEGALAACSLLRLLSSLIILIPDHLLWQVLRMDKRFAEILAHFVPKVPSGTSFDMARFQWKCSVALCECVVSGFTLTLNPLFCIIIAVLDSRRRFAWRFRVVATWKKFEFALTGCLFFGLVLFSHLISWI